MGPKILLLLLCFSVALRPIYCESKTSGDDERARLPEFLTELDLASLEASEEDIEALKTVVKRLAPEKNGEYQVYQGVMGQPGVDFPALTTIPATTFSCRGLKGGYYADLETNCQVFHICDNGRKISFLCPNGTIFQQSQLICDWWFKVDCSKSQELYEQSAEQLAEEERKRTETKRMNSEFHRSSIENDYQTQNSNYDGRQNGRTNPFGQQSSKNQITGSVGQRGQNTEYKSTTRDFDPNQIYNSNGVTSNQFNQINDLAGGNTLKETQDITNNNQNNYKSRQQQKNQSPGRSSLDRTNYRPVDRQQNQLVEGLNEETKRQFNYEQRGASKFSGSNQNNYNNQQQPARSNQQSLDYSSSNRNGGRDNERRNFAKSSSSVSSSSYEQTSNRVTPSYTETTTFRTSTSSPIREYQQLAESAAFATNRGNRFNEAYSSSQFNSYYDNFNANANGNNNNNNNNNNNKSKVQQKTTEKPRQKSITPTPRSDKITGNFVRVRGGSPSSLPFATFQPIYKPRTSESYSSNEYETTKLGSKIVDSVTTTFPSYTDYNNQNNPDKSIYNDNFDYGTTTMSYPSNEESQVTTEMPNTEFFTDDYLRNSITPINHQIMTNGDFFDNTTPTIITSGIYVNAKAYTSNKLDTSSYKSLSVGSGSTTLRPSSNLMELKENSPVKGERTNESTARLNSEINSHNLTTPTNYRDVTIDQNTVNKRYQENNNQQHGRGLIKNSSRNGNKNSQRESQNLISTSTEKSSKFMTTIAQTQTGFTGKTLSPYDTSFTYQQGKVMSTLGPYVPFTKNYAYSTTTTTSTTAKAPFYTATVPTYSSTANVYRSSSAKNLGKIRVSSISPSARPTTRLRSGSAAYLPEKKSEVSTYLAKKHNLNERPLNEREHAMSMIESLRRLDGTVPSLLGVNNTTRNGLNIPTSSGPSTLHSLALYFATASDDFDTTAESRTDLAAESESMENREKIENIKKEDTSVELPTNILTQHTINSYAELFNLNNALEGNSSIETSNENISNEENDDLDIQQSEGPLDGVRKSNSTRLRELAQVFTHALSAYLQDPDTFKKILTDIRPTEPTINPEDEEKFTASTFVPTTLEDYPSVTKEKDEVLDFSDDTIPPRGRRPTTIYPLTTTDFPITTESFNQPEFYTNSGDYYTNVAPTGGNSDELTARDNNFAFQVNHAFGTGANGRNDVNNVETSGGVYYPEEANGSSDTTSLDPGSNNYQVGDYADNYFPTGESGDNKIGGFHNDTQSGNNYEAYGKDVKPFDATPINDNYVSSSTPSTYIDAYKFQHVKSKQASDQRYRVISTSLDHTSNSRQPEVTRKSENLINNQEKRKHDDGRFKGNSVKSTTEPFRIRYYDPTTSMPWNNHESLVTAGSAYSKYHENRNDFKNGITERPKFSTSVVTSKTVEPATRKFYTESVTNNQDEGTTIITDDKNNKNNGKFNNHWTSSPTVTQLWESTVFVDPKRINQGLVSDTTGDMSSESSTLDYSESTENPFLKNHKNNQESLVTDATSSGLSSRNSNNLEDSSSPWKLSGSTTIRNTENHSPTAFTLLPQKIYTSSEQNIATASPIYTTRSSITTTITSSVTSTSSKSGVSINQDDPLISKIEEKSEKRPKHGIDDEMEKAHEMFGKLNTTSTNTLMRVMKQADTNATVRQLVLLLINHCNGPMNKTMEEEKEQLLDALLKMPVNEFTSEESRELVAGINKIHLPIGKNHFSVPSTTMRATTSTEEPIVTTFRSKKGRRFKSNAEEDKFTSPTTKNDDIVKAENGNVLSTEDTSASDARALELLRSLYTIAAKWG